jgi:7-keto-8-aminopelargonate synthetase-like enzyme
MQSDLRRGVFAQPRSQEHFHSEALILMPTTDNQTLFATAPQRGDLVVHDEWIHASVRDGMRQGPVGTARLRIAWSLNIDETAIVRLFQTLALEMARGTER